VNQLMDIKKILILETVYQISTLLESKKDVGLILQDFLHSLKTNILKIAQMTGISVICVVNKLLKNNKIFGYSNVLDHAIEL